MVKNIDNWFWEDGKKVARKTRFQTIKKNSEKYKKIYLQNRQFPDFASWWYETTLLGYSHSMKLRDVFAKERPTIQNIKCISECSTNSNVEGVAQISEIKQGISKKGNKYIKMIVSDEDASYDAMIVARKMEDYCRSNPIPEKGNIIFVTGQKGDEIVWINRMKIQDNKVFLKLRDLKR